MAAGFGEAVFANAIGATGSMGSSGSAAFTGFAVAAATAAEGAESSRKWRATVGSALHRGAADSERAS
jgi:hypothetical protein